MAEKTPAPTPSPAAKDPTDTSAELHGLEKALTKFSDQFAASAKRWELLIYPSMFIFSMLAVSGFYLIFSLTQDIRILAQNVDPKMAAHMDLMSDNISQLAKNIDTMRGAIQTMNTSVVNIDGNIASVTSDMGAISGKMDALDPMLINIADMNASMRLMTASTGFMSRDMSQMNSNISRPMSFMNSFTPW